MLLSLAAQVLAYSLYTSRLCPTAFEPVREIQVLAGLRLISVDVEGRVCAFDVAPVDWRHVSGPCR